MNLGARRRRLGQESKRPSPKRRPLGCQNTTLPLISISVSFYRKKGSRRRRAASLLSLPFAARGHKGERGKGTENDTNVGNFIFLSCLLYIVGITLESEGGGTRGRGEWR